MKIYLFLENKAVVFILPKKVNGSFCFDENPDAESKLLNIEANGNSWNLYSTDDVEVEGGNVLLKSDSYYNITRDKQKYLIYVTDSFDETFSYYKYNNNINLIIGNNDENCNIIYNNPKINGAIVNIYIDNGALILVCSNKYVYINNIGCTIGKNYTIYNGDEINILGLKIVFFNGFILINNPINEVKINALNQLSKLEFKHGDKPKDFEPKDVDLYEKSDYFSKSPRLRRLIKTKEIKLSAPPNRNDGDTLPFLLTVGPMLTMAIISGSRLVNVFTKIFSGQTTFAKSWVNLLTPLAMMISMLVWPTLSKRFNKKLQERKNKEIFEKYSKYLDSKRIELDEESSLQREILYENIIPVEDCLNIVNVGKLSFWDKRTNQNDFLVVRIGKGDELLDVEINYPDEGFTIEEDDLRKAADKLIEDYKYVRSVPIGYSLYKNKVTALLGNKTKYYGMIHNIILQLITFYSYDDIKIVVFTNDENSKNWEYIKYLNHSLSNDKNLRFFSTNQMEASNIMEYLASEFQQRIQNAENLQQTPKPYYIIITDDYAQIKMFNFIQTLTEVDVDLGFSIIFLEERMSRLPSKCSNFINLGTSSSGVLKDSFESQEVVSFNDEINYNIDMMWVARKVSNVPIEFADAARQLPEAINFMEMENISKVEQLNIANRWEGSDPIQSLKAEVGIGEDGNLMFLDLHEKFHGPHGLIAGMTGSGKSEFIITYILSMAINYSPDYVSFILIDYKGGGLAGAFENSVTGVYLPHLAGTITNLDKAEMDRTLVSIDSELKRRQSLFNAARDNLGESTIDIYKYQKFYKEGKLSEPIPHLFIICDEFAELKVQQPDFMANLISVARIGRSLGVHLILATQKPSGVVNDQIWSNTKFRVCLKVQDASDSKEMLKKPDAANLKQTGRFYLQVGYDEYYALGQSAWCGAKYYPSEKIIKQIDRSLNFIGNTGNVIKSIQAGNNIKVEPQGEQISAIMNNIIEVAKKENKIARRLWLIDIPETILIDTLKTKYEYKKNISKLNVVIGEYDAPELQKQGLLEYSAKDDGNAIIYGNDDIEKEKLLMSIMYSTFENYTSDEINYYVIDYGSEQLRAFEEFPQVGGMAFLGDDEKFKNLFKLIRETIKDRKKILMPYGGSIDTYNEKNEKKLPQMVIIMNNYESILENYINIGEEIASISRECDRYGINMIITCSNTSSLGRKISQNFQKRYAMHLTDAADYYTAFNMKCRISPRDRLGRGLVYNGAIHEFQTASIVGEDQNQNEKIMQLCKQLSESTMSCATPIPSLPEKVTYELIQNYIHTIRGIPIGIYRNSLDIIKYDFGAYPSTVISANKITYLTNFLSSLVDIFINIPKSSLIIIDPLKNVENFKQKETETKKMNYFSENLDAVIDQLNATLQNPEMKQYQFICLFIGINKISQKTDSKKMDAFFKTVAANENVSTLIVDGVKGIQAIGMETWYSKVKNNADGIWVGSGFDDQQVFRISSLTKEMKKKISNDFGYVVNENSGDLAKYIDFSSEELIEEEVLTDEE